MNAFQKLKLLVLTMGGSLLIIACVKDDDWTTPPANCSDEWTAELSMEELFARVHAADGEILQFDTDQIIEGYVVSSDSSGNFFKTLSIQNSLTFPSRGVQIEMDRTNLFNNFPLGSKIKVNLKGLDVGYDRGMLKIGEIYNVNRIGRMMEFKIDKHVVSSCDEPENVNPLTFSSIESVFETGVFNTLITIENVQFVTEELGTTYADAQNNETINKTLIDINGDRLDLRNSGYASFANELLPEGSGSITVVLSGYDLNDNGTVSPGEYQVYIRDTEDVKFDNPRFGPLFLDSFDSGFANWTQYSEQGSQVWEIRDFGIPAPCAYISAFEEGAQTNEDWLISNAIHLPVTMQNAFFSFQTDRGYNGNELEVFYTTNFTGDVNSTVWTPVSATLDTNNNWNSWTYSGDIDVSSAIGGSIYVAFKYTSNNTDAATWELDNVKIFEN